MIVRALGLVIKAVMIVVIIVGIASYISYLQTGRFWIPKFSMASIKSPLPSIQRAPTMQALEAPQETIYKWRDQGKWVYGQTPPTGVTAQLVSEKKE